MGLVTTTTFRCPRCGRKSRNPNDAAEGYCGACHAYTGDEPPRRGQLPHLNVHELRALHDALGRALLEADARQSIELVVERLAAEREPDPDLAEDMAVLRSLRTAVDESLLHAVGEAPVEPLRLLADLRRRLGALAVEDVRGRWSGADMFGKALDAMESFVVNHLRARSAQQELPGEPTPDRRGWEPVQTILDELDPEAMARLHAEPSSE